MASTSLENAAVRCVGMEGRDRLPDPPENHTRYLVDAPSFPSFRDWEVPFRDGVVSECVAQVTRRRGQLA